MRRLSSDPAGSDRERLSLAGDLEAHAWQGACAASSGAATAHGEGQGEERYCPGWASCGAPASAQRLRSSTSIYPASLELHLSLEAEAKHDAKLGAARSTCRVLS